MTLAPPMPYYDSKQTLGPKIATLLPRPHQIVALDALDKTFAASDRAQLVMACGTGKTLTCRWHAIRSGSLRTLVLLPSLLLIAQTLREWRRTGPPFEALVVCSDPATSDGKAERDDETPYEDLNAFWASARAKVTTSPVEVRKFLEAARPSRPMVVFSTYHSSPVVERGQQLAESDPFELMICDEAHRLAGDPKHGFRVPTDQRRIRARRRLFTTATPQIVTGPDTVADTVLSMDDPAIFGPVAHTLTFGQAIEARLLTDYQVVVVGHRPGTRRISEKLPAAVVKAVNEYGIRRLISFHSRVARAEAFAQIMDGVQVKDGRRIGARHVSGYMSADDRARALAWLGAESPQTRLLSNARCLTEGVDVPVVDGIVFADRNTSQVAITQAVGRALRRAPGKAIGTIIVPVELPEDGDDDSALASSAFAHVWAVLRALRAHDQRLAREIDTALAEVKSDPSRRSPSERLHFLLPEEFDTAALHLRLVREVGSAWEGYYALLQDHAAATGGEFVKTNLVWKGRRLGMWARQQRIAHGRGLVHAHQVRRLEAIPGWAWDRSAAQWQRTYNTLADLAAELGSLEQPADGPSIYTGLKDTRSRPLGNWVAGQCQLHRDGMLDPGQAARLEDLPGWRWDGGLTATDVTFVQALRVYCEFEKHADVPDDYVDGDLPLGQWVLSVRRRNVTGNLHPRVQEEIAAATPRGAKGAPVFQWRVAETRWRLALSALRTYADREGHAAPPNSQVEALSDTVIKLGQWAARQRFLYNRHELAPEYVLRLEAMPGWVWQGVGVTKEYGEPIDLDGHRHGTGKGVAANCPCEKCLEARRAYDRERLARRRDIPGGVAPGPAAAHLRRLIDGGAKVGPAAIVSGVPLGTVKLVLAGNAVAITPDHHRALLALTVEACLSAPTRAGTRGRVAALGNDLVDAAPMWAIIDDLVGRGFGMLWISRELGYANGMQFRKDRVQRRIADALADLATRVGDRRAPALSRNRTIPPLADLECVAEVPR